jgi:uncharacterized protein YecT (DUF1311 family)
MKAAIMMAFLSLGPSEAMAACSYKTQADIDNCAVARAEAADARLKATYNKLTLTPELIAVQKSWLAYRDAECEFERSQFPEGSMYGVVYPTCLETLSNQRTEVLRSDLADQAR